MRTKLLYFTWFWLTCQFVLPGPGLHAQQTSLFTNLCGDSLPTVYLSLDWKRLEKHRKEKVYNPAVMEIIRPAGDSLRFEISARTRGNMRLQLCSFPPMKIKFSKGDLRQLGMNDMNELDVVHHCHAAERYDQCLLKEYLAYKLYELITPYHFRTTLVKLNYRDQEGEVPFEPTYAMLKEDEEELALRLGAKEIATPVISQQAIERSEFLKVCLFQFMIGNTDWFITNRHNLEFLGVPGHKLMIVVPYDFDYSGLVGAPYAAPHESLQMGSVNARYYQGWCHSEEEVKQALIPFLDNKDKILSMPAQIPGLDEAAVKQCTRYLEEFFEIVEHPKKFENQVLKHCDMWPVKN